MKIKELIRQLKKLDENDSIIFGSDEELNNIRKEGEVARYDEGLYVVYGLDGTEMLEGD